MFSCLFDSNSIILINKSTENLICTTHYPYDKLQLLGEKYNLIPENHLVIPTENSLMLHFYRPGLFGLISPRVRLSSGFGFLLEVGNTYHVNLCSKDENNNLVSIKREITTATLQDMTSTQTFIGNMIIKPSIRLIKYLFKLPVLNFDPNIYRDYLSSRNGNHLMNYDRTNNQPSAPTLLTDNNNNNNNNRNNQEEIPYDIPERELWGIFFDQLYFVGLWGLFDASYLTIDDIECQEPFLFIGLPSVSLFNMTIRSLSDPNSASQLRLIDGRIVNEETCPNSYRMMFQLLLQTKTHIIELNPRLENEEVEWIREFLLYAGSDKKLKSDESKISIERQDELKNLFSNIVSISTQLTQQSYYKENFLFVLESLIVTFQSLSSSSSSQSTTQT